MTLDAVYRQIGRQYVLNFAAKGGKSQKIPTCKKGWNCGYSCQSKDKKNCRSSIDGQAATYADWLANQVSQQPKPKSTKAKTKTTTPRAKSAKSIEPKKTPVSTPEPKQVTSPGQVSRNVQQKPDRLTPEQRANRDLMVRLVKRHDRARLSSAKLSEAQTRWNSADEIINKLGKKRAIALVNRMSENERMSKISSNASMERITEHYQKIVSTIQRRLGEKIRDRIVDANVPYGAAGAKATNISYRRWDTRISRYNRGTKKTITGRGWD